MTRIYTAPARWLHWGMAVLIAGIWALGFAASSATPGANSPKALLIETHKSIAVLVLVLVIVRLAWRAGHPPPALDASDAMRFAARAGHWLLYALMIVMPLTGWLWTSSAGRSVQLLGLIELPALIGADPQRKEVLGTIHRTLAWALAVMVVGHVLFALKHHLIDRDPVLQSMLPRRR